MGCGSSAPVSANAHVKNDKHQNSTQYPATTPIPYNNKNALINEPLIQSTQPKQAKSNQPINEKADKETRGINKENLKVEQPLKNSASMTQVLNELEAILSQKYGFVGNLQTTVYSENSEDAFKQLVEQLKKSGTKESLLKSNAGPNSDKNSPNIGDIALVYWYGYGWFTARIEEWMADELKYLIRWTDGNWAPEKAKYTNLCVDRIPDSSTIGVGTKVLFKQGLYYCGNNDDGSVCDSTGRTLSEKKKKQIADLGQISDRWHMGRITRVYKDAKGETLYDGEHVTIDDPQCTRGDYVDYHPEFRGLKLEELRTLPNIYNCLHDVSDQSLTEQECDIFISKVNEDDSSLTPILQRISKYSTSASLNGDTADSLQKTVGFIRICKVYIVCLSDNFIMNQQAMSELLYAKKTLSKPVIPLVIGDSKKWSETTAGMLLAGQLYIQFQSQDNFVEKLNELETNLSKLIVKESISASAQEKKENNQLNLGDPPNIFLSYCWSNSKTAFESNQVQSYSGHCFSDPRRIKTDIEKELGEKVWLDIERLDSVDDSGMFGQIAQGLNACAVAIFCVSKEYTRSQNCQMEANFALRSLHKEAIVIEVGTGNEADRNDWTSSSIGLVLPNHTERFIMSQDKVQSSSMYNEIIKEICLKLREYLEQKGIKTEEKSNIIEEETEKSSLVASVPMIGDPVIAFYAAWQFFPAKVVSFDSATMKYTVDWDDPDPSCRVQPYNLVAVNRNPHENEIGVGTSVLFKQGVYRFGNSVGDVWNLGEITHVENKNGEVRFSGKHSKSASDGLAVATWPSYRPTFEGLQSNELRLFPNAIEMLNMYKKL